MSYQVYVFTEPDGSDTPRYVGVSKNALSRRYQHFAAAALPPANSKNPNSKFYQWLRPLILAGVQPEQTIVETLPDDATQADALMAEGRWIAKLRHLGCPLTNVGGPPTKPQLSSSASDTRAWAIQAERKLRGPYGKPGDRVVVAARAGVVGSRIAQLRTDPEYRREAGITNPSERRALIREAAIAEELRHDPPGAYGTIKQVADAVGVSTHIIVSFRGDPEYREAIGAMPRT